MEVIQEPQGPATRIELFNFRTPSMRAFHMAWFAFFVAFFGWFSIAALMPVVRDDLGLTKAQIGNIVIASVAITIVARLAMGWLCDRIGPRRSYSGLLILGSLPVMFIGLAQDYETFLVLRLAIGVLGGSFVITQFQTSVMFAPNIVGTANATTAGWGNMGGGVAQIVMPLVLAAIALLGAGEALGWRMAMIVPGSALFLCGMAYFVFTEDRAGDRGQKRPERTTKSRATSASFWAAARDHRVWALSIIYGASFGVELIIINIAALYFHDRFGLGLAAAGLMAGLFGLMNIFARTLGGALADRAGSRFGLQGRAFALGALLLLEGAALMLFSQMAVLPLAVGAMVVFSLFVKMSAGATYAVVPFINKNALGAVAGIVGAGGNAGAVAFGFLFRFESLSMDRALWIIGVCVALTSALALLVQFSADE